VKLRAKECCKSIAIVLLLCSLVLLTVAAIRGAGTVTAAAGSSGSGGAPAQETASDAAMPLEISALGTAGRVSWRGDFSALDAAFERYGGYLASAMDAASSGETISEADFLAALKKPGVCFTYPCALPVDLPASWLDASSPDTQVYAQRFLVTVSDRTVQLLIAGESYQRFDTGLDGAGLTAALEEVQPDGTFYACESGDAVCAALSPFTLFGGAGSPMPAASAANPAGDALLRAAATALGFNPYGGSYLDSTGATVYTESDRTLRAASDGTLTLQSSGGALTAPSASDAGLTGYAASLLSAAAADCLGDARLYVTGFSRSGSSATVSFDYILSGLPVSGPSVHAATFVFTDGILREMDARLRTYTLDASAKLSYLPVKQAAAISAKGSYLSLRYADSGADALSVGWKAE